MTAVQVLNRDYLEMRAKILELAATFDRLERGDGSVDDDQRMAKLREALDVLRDDRSDRAEQVQLIFSRQYHHDWPKDFALKVVR